MVTVESLCIWKQHLPTKLTLSYAFSRAVAKFGLPSRMRADHGGENILVARFMMKHPDRGQERGSFIVGRSIHNQCIEWLWRQMPFQKLDATIPFILHTIEHLINFGFLECLEHVRKTLLVQLSRE